MSPLDFLDFDSLLSDEERLVRRAVAEMVEQRAQPLIRSCYREGRFPLELVPAMAQMGLFGANLEGYGCAGMGEVEYGLALRELERCDSGLRSFVSVQSSLTMFAIWRFGDEEQKRRWLPEMAAGRAIGCFGLTEPNFGSNPAGMTTRARPDGAGYVLDGEKTWITNGSLADVAVVWAKHGDGDEVRGFLVERGTPGFSASDLHNKMSMRASTTSSLSFAGCRIPASAALPGAAGLKAALACLNNARVGIGWGTIGAAEACFEEARAYTLARTQFGGRPLASHQLVQAELAWMVGEIAKAQLLALHVARLKERGRLHFRHVSLLKRNNARMALEVARRARDLLGANGIVDESPVFRHLCNLETVKTYEGTDNIHALIIGQAVTGLPAFE